jgi:hypothetical protein
VTVAAGMAAAPAGATTLQAHPQCDSGNWTFICQSVASGGTTPYTYLWAITSGPAGLTSSTTAGSRGTCSPGYSISIKVTVTDAAHSQVTASTFFVCESGPYQ